MSNDTWFGQSAGPIQHLEIAQNRALEHKKPLIRATNSGISAIISGNGGILEKQDYFEEKDLKASVLLYSGIGLVYSGSGLLYSGTGLVCSGSALLNSGTGLLYSGICLLYSVTL